MQTRAATAAVPLVALLIGALAAGCLPTGLDYWSDVTGDTDTGSDFGGDADSDVDTDADADADTDTDADTDDCVDDPDASTCGDGGGDGDTDIDTDTLEVPDGGEFCGNPAYLIFISDAGVDFDNSAAPYKGNLAEAEVELTGFSYFWCPHCATAAAMMSEIYDNPLYSERTVYHFRHFPFSFDTSLPYYGAHAAAHAAHLQGEFWAFHDLIYGNYGEGDWETLYGWAEDLGLDMEEFDAGVTADSTYMHLSEDKQEGQGAGVTGTPSIFINGVKVYPWSSTQDVLDCILGYSVWEPPDAGP